MVSMVSWVLLGVIIACVHGLDAGQKISQLATANSHFLEGTVFIRDKNTIEIRWGWWKRVHQIYCATIFKMLVPIFVCKCKCIVSKIINKWHSEQNMETIYLYPGASATQAQAQTQMEDLGRMLSSLLALRGVDQIIFWKVGETQPGLSYPCPSLRQVGTAYNNHWINHSFMSGKNWQFEDKSIPAMRNVVNENILLSLPPGVEMSELKWLSLWCRRYKSNFGQVRLNSCE